METSTTLHAEIAISTADRAKLRRFANVLALMRECFPEIITSEEADLAAGELVQLRAEYKIIDDKRQAYIRPAREIIERANADHKPALDAIKAADQYLAGLLSRYETEQRRIAEETRRAQEQKAREERERQEREIAAQRAQLEEQARQKAQEAAQSDNPAEAASAKLQAEQLQDAAIEAGQTQLELSTAPLHVPEVSRPAIAGVGMSDHWVAEYDGSDETVLTRIAAATFGINGLILKWGEGMRPELLALLELNKVAINKQCQALKSATNIPGVRAVNKPIATRRGARPTSAS